MRDHKHIGIKCHEPQSDTQLFFIARVFKIIADVLTGAAIALFVLIMVALFWVYS